jgi:Tfp pilus assembly protein PilF
MKISPVYRDNSETTSLADEIKSLVPAPQKISGSPSVERAYRFLTETLANELERVADQGQGYLEARQVIQSHQQLMTFWDSLLSDMLANLEHMEQARSQREIYSPRWWEQTVQALQQAFDQDPEAAFQQWVLLYAQALVDWELETCRRLVSTSLAYPRDKYPYALLIRHGSGALQDEDYPAALEMLSYLVNQLSEAASEKLRLLGALLSIFIGRIRLYKLNEPELARTIFERAAALAPRDGRPLAALGHIALEQGDDGLAEANRLFSRAIEFSPDQPDGHVGKAMIAEKRELWSEADEWYKAALQEALDERDVLLFLSKMLAPGGGRLYLQAAQQFYNDNVLDRAQEAIEVCLKLGMEDGTRYPSRSAIALKADILAAASGPERTPEQAKTIAGLYFEAGQYYTWNDEYPAGISLFKKAGDMDGSHALARFYLADSLRVLSHTTTPPYADEKLARESLAAWEAGMHIPGFTMDADTAWIYIARARIAKQLAYLSEEDYQEHYWQAILFNEQALLLNDYADWWAQLSNSYNELELYANMLYLLQKAIKAHPHDLFTLGERAKVLVNTGQDQQARTTLNKILHSNKADPKDRPIYLSWMGVVDYYQGHYTAALEDIEPTLKEQPDNLWAISLRANIYRAMGDDQAAMQDEIWIWERREHPDYQSNKSEFAWSAFRQGLFQEAIQRIEPFLGSIATDGRNNAQLLTGLSYLAMGEIKLADEYLTQLLETCTNPRVLVDLVIELELLQRRAAQARWSFSEEVKSYLTKTGGILKQAKARQKKMKAFTADPVKELEFVLSDPLTGKPDSSSWLAAQLGLGRLHLEAERLQAAERVYQALLPYAARIPEASLGLEEAQKGLGQG